MKKPVIKSTVKIARCCPLVIQGFSNSLGLFQVIMANPDLGFKKNMWGGYIGILSLKLTVCTSQKERIVFKPSIFRCKAYRTATRYWGSNLQGMCIYMGLYVYIYVFQTWYRYNYMMIYDMILSKTMCSPSICAMISQHFLESLHLLGNDSSFLQ